MTQAPAGPRPATTSSGPPPRRLVGALVAALVASLAVIAVLTALLVTGGRDSGGQEAGEPLPDDGRLAFAPPELEDPETVRIGDDRSIELDDGRDYVLELPDEPLEGGFSVSGGDDVVLVGGEVTIPSSDDEDARGRGMRLAGQTGVVHVEGVAITGEGLKEGINLDQRDGAVVQLQNIRVDTVQGSKESDHADVVQVWAGPRALRVDRLSASTQYQGFFLLPQQFGEQDEPEEFDLRHVDVRGTEDSAYLLWRDEGDWPLRLADVWLSRDGEDAADLADDRDRALWPKGSGKGTEAWDGVQYGEPPGGPFVPEGVAGTGYESPGYADAG